MVPRPPKSTRTDTLVPYTTRVRSRPVWNGIVVAKDGSRLYAAAWPDREVVEFILGRSGPVRSVAVDFLPDNLHWTTDGAIIVAGQDSAAKAVTDCFFSTAATCGLDSGFARLDPDRMQLTRSEERRVGKECVSACRSRWSTYH